MKISFIGGTGNLGYGMALRCAVAGYEVLIGSRESEKAENAAKSLNELVEPAIPVRGGGNPAVAAEADLVVISLPYVAHKDTLPLLVEAAKGKVVLDTTVPMVYGKPPVYSAPEAGSAAQGVQNVLEFSKVGSGFHTMSAASLSEKDRVLDSDALICGDDQEAKELVSGIFNAFIPRIFDIGALSQAQSIERLTPLVIALNQQYKRKHIGIKLSNV